MQQSVAVRHHQCSAAVDSLPGRNYKQKTSTAVHCISLFAKGLELTDGINTCEMTGHLLLFVPLLLHNYHHLIEDFLILISGDH